jgi:hypothetical protein
MLHILEIQIHKFLKETPLAFFLQGTRGPDAMYE